MNTVARKAAALALGLTIAGGLLGAFAWWRGIDISEVDPVRFQKQLAINEETPAAAEFKQQLLAGLTSANRRSWVGEYSNSNGYERRVVVLSPGGFFYEYSHCTGTGELSYGEVESVDGPHVRLTPRFQVRSDSPRAPDPSRRSDFWFEPDLYVIKWSGEQFLVPASQMPEFCALAKAEKWQSMRYADYPRLKSEGDRQMGFWDSKLEGLPEVPAEFKHLLPTE